MNSEKILEIANRYTSPEAESRILFGADGNATGGTVTMTYWNFCEEELIAFAQSVIEEGCPTPARKPLSEDEIDDGLNEFVKWLKAQDQNIIRDPFSAAAGWAAGQRAERERIKKIIYEATDGGRGNYELLIERIG